MITRMLKFFVFVLCFACPVFNTYCATADGSGVTVTVLDKETKQPIQGIKVKANNTAGAFEGISNDQGVATIARKKNANAEVWSNFQYNDYAMCRSFQSNKVKICTEDTENIYASSCVTFSTQNACNIKIHLAKKASKKIYSSPQEMAKMGRTRGGKLKFYPVCDKTFTDYPPIIPESNRHCIDKFFKNTRSQMLTATELATLYVLQKYDQLIECSVMFETRNGDDYLQCVSIGDSGSIQKHAYEFRFRNLNFGLDSYIQNYTADAICRLPGGKEYDKKAGWCDVPNQYNYTGAGAFCINVDRYAQRFGWNANILYANPASEYVCAFNFNSKVEGSHNLRKYGSIDPYIFQHMKVQSNNDLVLLLNQYVRFQTMDEFERLECDNSFTKYYSADSVVFHDGNVVTCHLTTVSGKKYDLDFLFRDVSETDSTKAAAGKGGMQCIASGGNFDGINCSAIGRMQCDALKDSLPGGAIWDDKLGVCRMPDAKGAQRIEDLEKIIQDAAGLAIGIILAPPTGGASIVVWVASSVVIPAVTQYLKNVQNQYVRDFVITSQICTSAYQCNANKCNYMCNPDSNCAKNTLMSAYGEIKHMLPDNDSGQTDSQLAQAVTFAHDSLWSKITKKCVDENFAKNLQNAVGEFENTIMILDAAGAVLALFSAATDVKGSVSKVKDVKKIFSTNKNAMDAMVELYNLAGKLKEVPDNIRSVSQLSDVKVKK